MGYICNYTYSKLKEIIGFFHWEMSVKRYSYFFLRFRQLAEIVLNSQIVSVDLNVQVDKTSFDW